MCGISTWREEIRWNSHSSKGRIFARSSGRNAATSRRAERNDLAWLLESFVSSTFFPSFLHSSSHTDAWDFLFLSSRPLHRCNQLIRLIGESREGEKQRGSLLNPDVCARPGDVPGRNDARHLRAARLEWDYNSKKKKGRKEKENSQVSSISYKTLSINNRRLWTGTKRKKLPYPSLFLFFRLPKRERESARTWIYSQVNVLTCSSTFVFSNKKKMETELDDGIKRVVSICPISTRQEQQTSSTAGTLK